VSLTDRVHPLTLGEARVARRRHLEALLARAAWSPSRSSRSTPRQQQADCHRHGMRVAIVGDIVRKVDLNGPGRPTGLFYDREAMRRAIADIGGRSHRVMPAHDPAVAPAPVGGLS
jgi:hypothetical protein